MFCPKLRGFESHHFHQVSGSHPPCPVVNWDIKVLSNSVTLTPLLFPCYYTLRLKKVIAYGGSV